LAKEFERSKCPCTRQPSLAEITVEPLRPLIGSIAKHGATDTKGRVGDAKGATGDASRERFRVLRHRCKLFARSDLCDSVTQVTQVTQNRGPFPGAGCGGDQMRRFSLPGICIGAAARARTSIDTSLYRRSQPALGACSWKIARACPPRPLATSDIIPAARTQTGTQAPRPSSGGSGQRPAVSCRAARRASRPGPRPSPRRPRPRTR
jgi:hypothetical protein